MAPYRPVVQASRLLLPAERCGRLAVVGPDLFLGVLELPLNFEL